MTEDGDIGDESESTAADQEFEEEQTVAREEAAALLHDLADGVASGSVAFDDGAFTVDVPATVELELEYERDDDEHEIEVELEWGDGPEEDDESVDEEGDGSTGEDDESVDEEGDGPTGEDDESVDEEGDGEADDETGAVAELDLPSVGAERAGSVVVADGAGVEGVVGPGPEPRSRARFELYRDRADEWRWRLVHHNGNIIADGGEGYGRRRSARNGLESVRQNAPGATVVEQD